MGRGLRIGAGRRLQPGGRRRRRRQHVRRLLQLLRSGAARRAYNRFKRGSIRVNTIFSRGKLNFGENIAVAIERHYGGLPDDPDGYAEDGILGKNILLQPVVPVYDIDGNSPSGKAAAWATRPIRSS